jgi:mycofactocin system glycosyltransferase
MLPDSFAVAADERAQRPTEHVLVRAAPGAAVVLTPAGAAAVDVLLAGSPVVDAHAKAGTDTASLVRVLLDAGIVHPRPAGCSFADDDVTVVIPAHDAATSIATAVRASGGSRVVVVDDGSSDDTGEVARAAGAHVVRRAVAGGPSAARNTGADAARTPLVAFVDADCRPEPGWLAPLLAHFDDPRVGAVAPRIVPLSPGASRLGRYEAHRSVLDQGPGESAVGPGTPRPLVPTAALVVRRDALTAVGGLDDVLRFGEDQDLVYRLAAGSWRVRYEPRSRVAHDHRSSFGAFARRRFQYGTPAAALARRHGALQAAVRLPSPIGMAALAQDLAGAGMAPAEAREVVVVTARRATRTTGHAATRVWLPAAAVLASRSRRASVLLGAALLARHVGDWRRRRPDVDPATWTGLRLVDEAALAAGTWWGAIRWRSLLPLLPSIDTRPRVEAGDGALVDRVVWLP